MKIYPGKIPKFETDIKISEPLRIDNKIIHFLARSSKIATEDGNILGGWVDPLAMVISEQNEEYMLSFVGREFTIDQLIEMAPSLRDILNNDKEYIKSH